MKICPLKRPFYGPVFLIGSLISLPPVMPSTCSTHNVLPPLIYPSNVRTNDHVSPKRPKLYNKLYSSTLQNTLTLVQVHSEFFQSLGRKDVGFICLFVK
jgi:hypothetical protein